VWGIREEEQGKRRKLIAQSGNNIEHGGWSIAKKNKAHSS